MTAPLLSIKNLTVGLPPRADRPHAVSDVTLTVGAGEIVCVVGESGSGKSMIANSVMGLLPRVLPVLDGEIQLDGVSLRALSPEQMRTVRGARVGMVFQEPMAALNPLMRIGDQIAEVFTVHRQPCTPERVEELLRSVNLPDPASLARVYPHMLSGGQRQRVVIAMAIALEPSLLVADEPTTALDVTTQAQILKLILDIQQRRGTGVLFITHDFGVVGEIADRVVVMQNGRVVEQGAAHDVLNRPSHEYTKKLLAAVPKPRTDRVAARPEQTMLEIAGLRKTFWRDRVEVAALNDVSLVVRRGETMGLVGESGSGKSTLARAIVNLVTPSDGDVSFEGASLRGLSGRDWKQLRKRIQFLFQDPFASLDPRRRVGDIISDGPRAHGASRTKAMSIAREKLELVSLDPSAIDRWPHEFSGGQRQRIGIARALAMDAQLLIADEPVSALDVSVQAQILSLLERLRDQLGLTMLFITHDMRVAARICDRIAVMKHGAIVEEAAAQDLLGNPQHPYTKALLASVPGLLDDARGAKMSERNLP
ncbi:ABC transporter ATP-binding protein [Bradyrhizobium sp. KBS0727]|uniref:dipeptide ABC transporter ATP-binding protein n=1 Tax=unclassified Bradyrhizobium TaxID=2631580 RepID=UPI00110DD170|nr:MULTISPECIES: ABC transporter ATP-binding protein [unclassified Bradyrhizobium]QDW36878.1 ABC transporter ATP-binding protein [Bradyrhizobium sp. KBS0725]QDW43478.1 ABC transporter ATP-binding protein [Bradyrhizobium sp. KBS0727]